MKRRTFVRNIGLSVAGLALYPGGITEGTSLNAKRKRRAEFNGGGTLVEHGRLRLAWEGGDEPRLLLMARCEGGWKEICELDSLGLLDVRLFATQFPFPSVRPKWEVERGTDHIMTVSTKVGGRLFTHRMEVLDNPARVRATSAMDLLGDEMVEWFQDRWAFAGGAPLDFAWTPNLRPEGDLVVGDHVFRAPSTILIKNGAWAALIPDLDSLASVKREHTMSADLDLEAEELPVFSYGLKAYQPVSHTYYRHWGSMLFERPAGTVNYTYEILAGGDGKIPEVTRKVTSYIWNKYASKYEKSVLPQTIPFSSYGDYSYPTLFKTGEFEEFEIDGRKSGGFKALNDGGYFRRPEHVLLNQAWYNNMRSSYGLYHFGRKSNNGLWQKRAEMIRRWTLSAPQSYGLFPAMYDFDKHEWWGSIPRLNGGRNRIECVNAAWTSVWLLWWSRDFGADAASMNHVKRLADFFVEEQLPSGAIPAWFDMSPDGANRPAAVETLKESAETAGSAMLLGELAVRGNEPRYTEALKRASKFLIREVIPDMKYWDFETFWSCSWKPLDMKDPHTGILPQNTFSAYWTAHTLLRAYEVTMQKEYLDSAVQVLDVLNFYQQVWNPSWLTLYAFGGFGVMNTDGEWNDARQAVFAPIYLDAYKLTGEPEYFRRGIAALRASFTLMAVPENKEVSPDTWNAFPLGLCPENFAHAGYNGTSARSDSDWGEAGALSAAALVENTYGGAYVDVGRGLGFGIDGCQVVSVDKKKDGVRIEVAELLGRDRKIPVVTDRGSRQILLLRANSSSNAFIR